ncbi:S1 RNA binding domain protein [Actinomyces sp. oral taxon 848 str. F0332]|nr:S1 RNA binding domain protein [Actinomyces sp. oral taxon 848 str. F0332]
MSDFVTDERENPHNGPASPVGDVRGDGAASNDGGQGGADQEGQGEKRGGAVRAARVRRPAARTRRRASDSEQADAESTEDATSAVAQSLAELEPKRRPRRRAPSKEVVESLEVIAEGASDSGAAARSAGATPQFSSPEDSVPEDAPPMGMTALLFQEPDVSRVRVRKRKSAEEPSEPASSPSRTRKRASAKSDPEQKAEKKDERVAGEGSARSAEEQEGSEPRRRKRGTRGRRKNASEDVHAAAEEKPEPPKQKDAKGKDSGDSAEAGTRRRRRRARSSDSASDEVSIPKGSTRLEAKRQRRREGREAGRRRHTITESEYLARRESVKREMLIREQDGLNQIAVLEDDVLVEHYVARHTQVSMVGNVYLGRVQNVLPSMEAAFVDIGKGRNAVLYAGEVNWEAAGLEGRPRRIEQALKSGDTVVVQVTKDPIGHKGARLTAQITLAGRHLVLVPSGAMTGISRKLPDKERQRLKRLLREIVPAEHGVIVRTAAEGTSEDQLRADVERLAKTWQDIQTKAKNTKGAPMLLKGEPELAVRVVRDIFNEDFQSLKIQGAKAWRTISEYVAELSPELSQRLEHWTGASDIFASHRVDEQLAKAFDRKVWLPSGGTLVIDRTEAMTVIDVNTGKFTGAGGTLEETVTRNNLEAAEEIVRQLRLRDIGGIIVIDFIDMVLEANRELVLRRLVECLGRDRTRHQVAEVTSLGLVQMTRKRVGQGLVEAFSTVCEACEGRGYIIHSNPVERGDGGADKRARNKQAAKQSASEPRDEGPKHDDVKAALHSIAAAAQSKHDENSEPGDSDSAQDSAKSADDAEGRTAEDGEDSKPGTAKARNRTKASAKKQGTKKAKGVQGKRGKAASVQAAEADEADGAGQADIPGEASEQGQAEFAERAESFSPGDAPEQGEAGSPASESSRSRTRRVSSSGTITPSAGPAILSFPAS